MRRVQKPRRPWPVWILFLGGVLVSGDLPALQSVKLRKEAPSTQGRKAEETPAKAPRRKTDPRVLAARKKMVEAGKLGTRKKGIGSEQRVANIHEALGRLARIEAEARDLPVVAAEAAFRQAVFLVRLGRLEDGVAAFKRAAASDTRRYGARALYEAGRAWSRGKRAAKALEEWKAAWATKDPKYGVRARLEIGHALLLLGRAEEARKHWKSMAEDANVDPVFRVRAYDALARQYLDAREWAEARTVLRRADETLGAAATGDGKKARSVRKALDRMLARKRLERILEKELERGGALRLRGEGR